MDATNSLGKDVLYYGQPLQLVAHSKYIYVAPEPIKHKFISEYGNWYVADRLGIVGDRSFFGLMVYEFDRDGIIW